MDLRDQQCDVIHVEHSSQYVPVIRALNPKSKIVLHVQAEWLSPGAVSPNKGPHVLLDAFSIVARRYPDVHLDVVGSLRNYPPEECFDLADRELIKSVAPFYRKDRL
jgi:glycosyltransferase involved in cell wall biosynthesis